MRTIYWQSMSFTRIKARIGGLLLALAISAALTCPLAAKPAPKPPVAQHVASIVFSPSTGEVLHAYQANRRTKPASLSKIMTAYLVFEDLDAGKLSLEQRFQISPLAAREPQVRFGLKAGEKVRLDVLLLALIVASGNDAAVAIAEAVSGSVPKFVERMNQVARKLGMLNTRFANPSGLPAKNQYTTARDLAVLAQNLRSRFAHRFAMFNSRHVKHANRSRGHHNRFLSSYAGATGMKTGFTCHAGYNLAASATRNEQEWFGIVLGSPNSGGRVTIMRSLLDSAFKGDQQAISNLRSLSQLSGQGQTLGHAKPVIAASCPSGPAVAASGFSGWSVLIGVARTRSTGLRKARQFMQQRRAQLRGSGRPATMRSFNGVKMNRVLVTGLSRKRAQSACAAHRRSGKSCIVVAAKMLRAQIKQYRRTIKLRRAARR